jgi:hypothetical protein
LAPIPSESDGVKSKRDWSPYEHSNMTEAGEAHAKEAEAGMAAEIVAPPESELRKVAAQWRFEENMRRPEQNLRPVPKPRDPLARGFEIAVDVP